MRSGLIKTYQRLPGAARSLVATGRGLYLRSWRYGRETERVVGETLERDYWDPQEMARWQSQRLAEILRRAATEVPYYRQVWSGSPSLPSPPWENLADWPILEKEQLRRNPAELVADGCDRRRMFHEQTSGTTGTPVQLWFRRPTVRTWYAMTEARTRRWFGISLKDRWAILGGQQIVSGARRRPPFWVYNAAMRQLYMSAFHLSPELIPHYLKAIRRYKVQYLLGYTSSLHALAQQVLESGLPTVPLKVVLTNAEPVLDYQREMISEAFACPVRETYGMCEIAVAAGECEQGNLHHWPDVGVLEVLVGDRPAEPGEAGDLVATGLLNADMPLIRYRTGDRVILAPTERRCPCGRTLPIIESIDGRSDDVLYTRDGQSHGRLDGVFKANLPLREAQIVQDSLDRVRIRIVPAQGYEPRHGHDMIQRLRERIGPVEVDLELLESIERTANGKFRGVVCNLPANERGARPAQESQLALAR